MPMGCVAMCRDAGVFYSPPFPKTPRISNLQLRIERHSLDLRFEREWAMWEERVNIAVRCNNTAW